MHNIIWVKVMLKRNFIDYRNMSTLRNTPSFFNVIKPKKSLTSILLNGDTLKNINNYITNAQKIINVYNQALPIIEQTKPMINNIKTTFNVMRAFRKISKEDSLENLFDKLPDYNEEVNKVNNKIDKDSTDNEVANPFYP